MHENTTLIMTDVVVRDTLSQENEELYGRGLEVHQGARAEIRRALFEGNRDIGILAAHAGTTLTLSDVVVSDTSSRESTGEFGRGLEAHSGARIDVRRTVFERNRDIGICISGAGTALMLEDVSVRETLAQENDGDGGRGLQASAGALIDLRRAVFDQNMDVGLLAAHAGTELILEDLVVRETRSSEDGGLLGRGLSGQDGARIEVNRAIFERNREVAVVGFGVDTTLALTHVVVRETLERECALTTCPGQGNGAGVGSYGGAHVELSRFIVTENVFCGLQLAHGYFHDEDRELVLFDHGGTMDLQDGEVSHNLIGANIQTAGFDVNRLADRVAFHDNERNLDMTELPVPGIEDSLSDAEE